MLTEEEWKEANKPCLICGTIKKSINYDCCPVCRLEQGGVFFAYLDKTLRDTGWSKIYEERNI